MPVTKILSSDHKEIAALLLLEGSGSPPEPIAITNGEWIALPAIEGGNGIVSGLNAGGIIVVSVHNGVISTDSQGNRRIVAPPNTTHGVTFASLTSTSTFFSILQSSAGYMFWKARRTALGAAPTAATLIVRFVRH